MMKRSNWLVMSALALIVFSLFLHDRLLSAMYLSGGYKNPYLYFVTLQNKNFDKVDLISSNAANVKFIQGPYKIIIDSNARDYVNITQNGRILHISANYDKNDFRYNENPYLIVISCPILKEVNAGASYQAHNKPVTDTIVREDWKMRRVLIDGFKLDSLSIRQNYGSTIELANNHISSLRAEIGIAPKSGSKLMLSKDNHFQSAYFNVLHKSQLVIDEAKIATLNYHLADSAQLVVSGASQQLIQKP
jgi:hypothetical protein